MNEFDTSHVPDDPFELQMWSVLNIEPNTIAGRPNAGNLALPFVQKYGKLPTTILADYHLRCLQTFIPGVTFRVSASRNSVKGSDWQSVLVKYLFDRPV